MSTRVLKVTLCVLAAAFTQVNGQADDDKIREAMDQFGWDSDPTATPNPREVREKMKAQTDEFKNKAGDMAQAAFAKLKAAATSDKKEHASQQVKPQAGNDEKAQTSESQCTPLSEDSELDQDPTFTLDVSGRQCFGLIAAPEATSALECRNACCDNPDCMVYQWCPMDKNCEPEDTCWVSTVGLEIERVCTPAGAEGGQVGWVSRAKEIDSTFDRVKAMLRSRSYRIDSERVIEALKTLNAKEKVFMMQDAEMSSYIRDLGEYVKSDKTASAEKKLEEEEAKKRPKKKTGAPLVEPEDSKVVVLDHTNFTQFVSEIPLVLAEFYAPWCGHCKRLFPDFTAASKLLEGKATLVKVDANEDENKGIARKFGVRGFPTLRVLRFGESYAQFQGPRDTQSIYDTMMGHFAELSAKDEL